MAVPGSGAVAFSTVNSVFGYGIAMSGRDLARIFRAFQPRAAIILVTAEWRPELRVLAERLHRSRLVEKPIHPGELRALVKALQSEGVASADPADRVKREAP